MVNISTSSKPSTGGGEDKTKKMEKAKDTKSDTKRFKP